MALPVTFTLTSTATQSNAPFAFGHVFAQGDIPAGSFVNSDLTDWQSRPTTYWPDGSLRHAIIAGRANTTANVPKAVVLSVSGTDRSGTSLTEANLSAALPTTTLVCGAETITLGALVGTAALHRIVCTGPVMSNWIYRKQLTGSNHLVAWFDVRLYLGGAVEIFPWIENGYLTVAGPINDVRTYTFTVGGVQKFSQSIDIKAHTRVPLLTGSTFSYWSTDPLITPKHDGTYTMASKMVPNYGWLNPSETTLDALIQTYTPNTLAGISTNMGSAGGSAAIIDSSQALYITSNGDARAWNAGIVFGLSGGSWSTHYRDDVTNEPINFNDRPNASLQGGTPTIPGATGGTNGTAVTTHQPSFGYLPWLLTGRWWFLEEQLYWMTYNYLAATTNQRRGEVFGQNTTLYPAYVASAASGICDGRNGTYTVRGAAWSLRGIAQSLAILPSNHSCYAAVKNSWESNVGFYRESYVTGSYDSGSGDYWVTPVFGVMSEYGNPYGNTDYWGNAGWQHGMMQQVWGNAKELELPQTTASALADVVSHNLKLCVGLAGGVAGWNYRRFIVYHIFLGDADLPNPWYSSFAEALTANELVNGTGAVSSAPGLSLFAHSSNTDFAVGSSSWPYFGQQLASLAYAVTHGVSGADDGWSNIVGASNYATVTAQFNNDPRYGIVPRAADSGGSIACGIGNAIASGSNAAITNGGSSAIDTAYAVVSGLTMYCGRFSPVSGIAASVGNAVASGATSSIANGSGNVTVSASTGNATASGRTAAINDQLPDWVPSEGTFANISLNTMHSVRPAGWPSSEGAGPFLNWVGGVYAEDFSNLGALVVYGSGHLSAGAPLWAGVWCFDLDTRQWVGRNVPSQPLLENADYNDWGESTVSATLGHTYPPHTYDGLIYRSPALGGGPSGSLISFFYPGGLRYNTVHEFDLSSPTAPPARLIDTIPMSGSPSDMGHYAQTALDEGRNGIWLTTMHGTGPLKFVGIADWSVTTYGASYGTYEHNLVYLPAPYDCLVGFGRHNEPNTVFTVFVCPIVNNVPQGFTQVTPTGTPPADGRCGGVWSTLLNCIVSYEAKMSTSVHRLTPPAPGNLTTGTWAWTSETVTGVAGIEPSNAGINTNNGLPYIENGAWGRFIEVPAARCFIWANGVNAPVQAWRLTGM